MRRVGGTSLGSCRRGGANQQNKRNGKSCMELSHQVFRYDRRIIAQLQAEAAYEEEQPRTQLSADYTDYTDSTE